MISSSSNFTPYRSHVRDKIEELRGHGLPAWMWTCRQVPNKDFDFWGCTANKDKRNPGCGLTRIAYEKK